MSPTATVVLALGTTALGALAAVAGSLAGPLVTGRQQHQQWLRDRRSDVLEEYFGVLQLALRDDEHRAQFDEAFPWVDDDEQRTITSDLMTRLWAGSARMQFYVNDELYQRARDVARAFQAIAISTGQRSTNDSSGYDEVTKQRTEFQRLVRRLQEESRAAVGVS